MYFMNTKGLQRKIVFRSVGVEAIAPFVPVSVVTYTLRDGGQLRPDKDNLLFFSDHGSIV